MVRVQRTGFDGDAWLAKAAKASARLIEKGKPKKFSRLYSDDRVRLWLAENFCRKCAFCEKPWDDVEVEHFRPKAGVIEAVGHTGYYWLAYTWSNLYPVCTRCNQRRSDPGGPTTGKGNHFGLMDESKRAWKHTCDLNLERPLLLDPCNDDPEAYLYISPTGVIDCLVEGDRRARYTIDTLGLNRQVLVDERREAFRVARELGEPEDLKLPFLAARRAACELRSDAGV